MITSQNININMCGWSGTTSPANQVIKIFLRYENFTNAGKAIVALNFNNERYKLLIKNKKNLPRPMVDNEIKKK